LKFENTEVFNFEGAFRGLRNPLESWKKSDSYTDDKFFILGENDLNLAKKLIRGGTEHRKFLRQIFVSVDITAPLYFFKEFDTYKVGTVANSTSTMHTLSRTRITLDNFEFDDFNGTPEYRLFILDMWESLIQDLEHLRQKYVETGEKAYWKELVRLIPSGWLQTRTITMNYENLLSMYYHRRNHKLTEWHQYCDWIETLPYTQALFDIG
jgi:hypothetical protein